MRPKTETPAAWRTAGAIIFFGGGSDVRLGDDPSGDAVGRGTLLRRRAGKVKRGGRHALVG